ncbi:MAG: transposase [Candidatus Methanomethylophilaceae archaeon]|nr:transposase [Candidatus Methanomethylophilaceae archaeon]
MEPYILEKDGTRYMYRSTSHYSKEKRGPVSEVEYMGRVVDGKLKPKKGYFYNEETGEFGRISAEPHPTGDRVVLRTRIFGDVHLLDALQRRLGILDDLVASFGDRLGREIMAVAFAYTIQPVALMHMEDVIDRRCIREVLGLPSDTDFSSPRMSELTESIGEMTDSMDAFFRRRMTGTEGELIFDLTSESTYSAKNPLAEWGRNKDKVKLRVIGLGVVTDRKGRPVMFYIYPGSMADVATLRRMVDDVVRLGGRGSTLVLDRGFVSPRSVMYLLEKGIDFVMPMILGDNPVMKGIITRMTGLVGDVGHLLVHNGDSYTVFRTQIGVRVSRGGNIPKRATVWEDPDGYDLLAEEDPEFGSADGHLDVFVFRNTSSAADEVTGMDVALDGMIHDMAGSRPRDPERFFQRTAGRYANLLEYRMTEEGMSVSIRQNAHTFAANRKGVFVMIAPAGSGRGFEDVLNTYAVRDVIEDGFLEDKSEGDGRTPRSGKRPNIRGRTFIRMVSSIMRMEMLNRISEVSRDRKTKAEDKPRDIEKRTPASLLGSLSNIEMIYGNGWRQMTELTRDNRLIYDMFDVGPTSDMGGRPDAPDHT